MSKPLTVLLAQVAAAHGITSSHIREGSKRNSRQARYEFCYLAAVETDEPIRKVAEVAGYEDWTSVTYAVRQHAIRNGLAPRSFMDARKGVKPLRMIDWNALALLVELRMVNLELTQVAVAKRAGIGRRAVSWATQAKPISADDLVAILVGLNIGLEEIVTEPLRAQLHPAQP